MKEAIGAYRHVAATDEFREIERLRSRARHNEASALRHARGKGRAEGKAEGIAAGMAEGQIKSAMAVLEARFGKIPADLHARLRNMRDDGAIETTVKHAATCQSLTEFQETLPV